MWVATIDFKAFDSITDNSIWCALKTCGIEHEYINFLNRLYKNQKATVMTDKESYMFDQAGRPADELALQHCSTTFHAGKRKKGVGICLGWRSRLPHEFALC